MKGMHGLTVHYHWFGDCSGHTVPPKPPPTSPRPATGGGLLHTHSRRLQETCTGKKGKGSFIVVAPTPGLSASDFLDAGVPASPLLVTGTRCSMRNGDRRYLRGTNPLALCSTLSSRHGPTQNRTSDLSRWNAELSVTTTLGHQPRRCEGRAAGGEGCAAVPGTGFRAHSCTRAAPVSPGPGGSLGAYWPGALGSPTMTIATLLGIG